MDPDKFDFMQMFMPSNDDMAAGWKAWQDHQEAWKKNGFTEKYDEQLRLNFFDIGFICGVMWARRNCQEKQIQEASERLEWLEKLASRAIGEK